MITREQEAGKYRRMWTEVAAYRSNSPGERLVPTFLDWASWQKGESLIDLGCGTGRASVQLQRAGFDVTCLDITPDSLDSKVRGAMPGLSMDFIEGCLWSLPPMKRRDWVFCCDVLEHIPPEHVDATLDAIARLTRRGAFMQIALWQDSFGSHINETLHLSVNNAGWWLERIKRRLTIVRTDPSGDGRLICLTAGEV